MSDHTRVNEASSFHASRPTSTGSHGDNSSNSFNSSSGARPVPLVEAFPKPLDEAALIGPAGDLVRLIAPHTESDPVAILVQFLLAYGTIIGRNAFAEVEASQHFMNEFAVLVGESAKARKGTSAGWIKRLFERIEPDWVTNRMQNGLSSGEGVIWAARDPIFKKEPIKEKGGKIVGYQEVMDDEGEADKRLHVVEEEFARALIVMNRESNILSTILRQAWDSGNLRVMTKQPYKATDAHISIVGHITRDELRRHMTDTAQVNGFANRFLWFMVKRSKMLPEGGSLQDADLTPLYERIRQSVEFGRQVRCINRDKEARAAWCSVYPKLTEGIPGLMGSVTSRADPHVMRLSCLYALLDRSEEVQIKHLEAALALWEYSEQSARYIFGDALGDPVADAVLKALRDSPQGMSRTEINNLFGRNQSAERITPSLALLKERGLALSEQVRTEGRPIELWKAIGGPSA